MKILLIIDHTRFPNTFTVSQNLQCTILVILEVLEPVVKVVSESLVRVHYLMLHTVLADDFHVLTISLATFLALSGTF